MLDRDDVRHSFIEVKYETDGMDYDEMLREYDVLDDFTTEDGSRYAVVSLYGLDVNVDCVDGRAVVHGDGVVAYDEETHSNRTFYFQKEMEREFGERK